MDATRLSQLKAEIDALAAFLADYDTSVSNYLNSISPTCVHFLDVIPNLSNATTAALSFNASWSGQSSSFGSMADFVYEVNAIQRNTSIFNMSKLDYYYADDLQKSTDNDFNNGESAKFISYIIGTAPDQGITI